MHATLKIYESAEKLIIKMKTANCINNTGKQILTFTLAHEEKYLILIELLTLNSNV